MQQFLNFLDPLAVPFDRGGQEAVGERLSAEALND